MKKNDSPRRTMRFARLHHGANSACSSAGYTLIETVIALALIATVLVPLVFGVYRHSTLAGAHRELIGIWLIEREAAIARTFPQNIMPVRRKHIGNDEWTIATQTTGTDPLQYQMSAQLRGNVEAEAQFFGRPASK